jgi:hypothetical protein
VRFFGTVGPNGCNCIGFVVDVVLVLRSGRKAGSYLLASALLVNVLSIHANDVNDANNVNNANNVDNVNDVNNVNNDANNADLAKTLLLTLAVFLFVIQ